MAGDGQPGLSPFQLEVARMFFALPASRGFPLAGESSAARTTPHGKDHRGPRLLHRP
jgi:hypothetical protein